MAKLNNDRHELFCQYYVTEINGKLYNKTQSAIKAGFSEKTASSQASRLLKNVNIRRRIEEIKKEVLDQLEIDKLYVLKKYKKIVDDDISNYLKFRPIAYEFYNILTEQEEERHDIDIEIADSENIDTWNISEISKGKDGQFKFKLHCKDKALSKIAEYMDLFKTESEDSDNVLNDLITAMNKVASGK